VIPSNTASSEDYYVEHRRVVRRTGKPVFAHVADLPLLTGFRGVYGVPAGTAQAVVNFGDVTPLTHTPVWSDTLFVDFDGTAGVSEARETLNDLGIAYEIWSTGRRGCHFHILTEEYCSVDLPKRHKQWVEDNLTGDWDPTIYNNTSIIRLPGTFHEKNPGQTKALAFSKQGEALKIPELRDLPAREVVEETEPTKAKFYAKLMQQAPQRNAHVYYMGKLSRECGVSEAEGIEAVLWWATSICNPPLDVSDRELERQFKNGRR